MNRPSPVLPVNGTRKPPGDKAALTPDFEAECVEFFVEVVQVFGVPPSVGQIYGLLYASPAPLSFSDIVQRLEISKGSASQGLQFLRSVGAVRSVEGDFPPFDLRRPHSESDAKRRDYFEPELSLRKLISGVLHERVAPLAATGSHRVAHLRDLAEREDGAKDFYLERVRQLETWRRRMKTVLPVLTTLLGPKGNRR
jgi:hypothetical protein